MAKDRMDVLELLREEAPDADLDFLREGLRVLIQAVTEAEVATKAGANFCERSSERITYRNSYRGRPWDTRVGAKGRVEHTAGTFQDCDDESRVTSARV